MSFNNKRINFPNRWSVGAVAGLMVVIGLSSCDTTQTDTGNITAPPGGIITPIDPNEYVSLSPGQRSSEFSFPVPGVDQAIYVNYEQQCDSASGNGICCVLTVDSPRFAFALFDPNNPNPASLVEGNLISELSGRMFAESSCSFRGVEASTYSPVSAVTHISAAGQSLVYSDVPVQSVGGNYFLHDISRRDSFRQRGRMSPTASISVFRHYDYEPNPASGITVPGYSVQLLRDVLYSYPISSPPDPVRASAFDAMVNTQRVYDFFNDNFNLNSWDSFGSSMYATVEIPFPLADVVSICDNRVIQKGSSLNAFYSGATNSIYFTPIVGAVASTLSVSLDVVAHEWGHAFLDNFSNLVYARESGALNEAFADWTGVRVSHANDSFGWRVGDEIRCLDSPDENCFIRDLSIPRRVNDANWRATDTASCPTPALCNDYCGVHRNSAIPNFAFYLLSEGGAGFDVTVTGLGIDRAYSIAYAANQSYWNARTDFAGARAGMEMAARMLFPIESDVERQVSLAWHAAGVGAHPDSTTVGAK